MKPDPAHIKEPESSPAIGRWAQSSFLIGSDRLCDFCFLSPKEGKKKVSLDMQQYLMQPQRLRQSDETTFYSCAGPLLSLPKRLKQSFFFFSFLFFLPSFLPPTFSQALSPPPSPNNWFGCLFSAQKNWDAVKNASKSFPQILKIHVVTENESDVENGRTSGD